MCLSATDDSTGSFAVFNSTLRLKSINRENFNKNNQSDYRKRRIRRLPPRIRFVDFSAKQGLK